jgi:death-on-curing protein
MRWTKDTVQALHARVAELTGGDPSLRSEALLESALGQAYQTFDGAELYPSEEEKAAALCRSLILNHPFTDGNKRTGVLLLLTHLSLSGRRITASDGDVVSLGLCAAEGKMTAEDILAWVFAHSARD